MYKKLLLAALILATTVWSVSAQKFKPSPSFLKGQEEINVIFNYSKVIFDKDSQAKYYKGKSKSWIEEWEGKRREANASSFLKGLNDELRKINVHTGDYPEAQYTIIVNVLNCDFGAYAGPFSVPAKLECNIQIVKTGTTEVLSAITLKESQNPYTVIGTPVDFDRMFLAFGEVGEEFGDKLYKKLK